MKFPETDGEVTDEESFAMRKSDVSSIEMAGLVWSDMLSMTSDRMKKLDTDEYEIEIEVTVRHVE